jgi:hypothetical protein
LTTEQLLEALKLGHPARYVTNTSLQCSGAGSDLAKDVRSGLVQLAQDTCSGGAKVSSNRINSRLQGVGAAHARVLELRNSVHDVLLKARELLSELSLNVPDSAYQGLLGLAH